MKVAEARGVILCEAARRNISTHEYKPMEVKIAVTGYGRSDKQQVTAMVQKLVIFGAKSGPGDAKNDKKSGAAKLLDDEFDAIAIGITHLATHR
jgi:Holliday junction resolvasome RuvABC endonuclease subunit